MTPLLEVRAARKSYGAVEALRDASLQVEAGEVVALLGDNGAGKSTLIKAVCGVHQLDGGAVLVDGEEVRFRGPAEARRMGIETLHQDLALFDNLTAVGNFHIARERTAPRWLGRVGLLRERRMQREWTEHLERLQVRTMNPGSEVGVMSGGQRQAIAVLRAVAFASRLVILDEPTAALGVRESRQVLELISRLPGQGIAVVLISHNLEEVGKVADRAVVLRHGRTVGEARPTAGNHEALVSMIVGATGSGADGPSNEEEVHGP